MDRRYPKLRGDDYMDKDSRVTLILVLSVTVACLGNSFLYGYNIGVVNNPAEIMKDFYNKTYYERRGGNWTAMEQYDAYLSDDDVDEAQAIIKYAVDTNLAGGPSSVKANETKRLRPEQFGAEMDLLLEDWELKILWSTTVAAFVLFGMFGAFSSAKIADFFGRRNGMIVITFVMFVAAIFGGITKQVESPECLIVSRVLVGLHSGWNIAVCPMYLAEISPKKIRGAIGTCHQLAITVGILFSQVMGLPDLLGTTDGWPYLFAFLAVPSLICLVGLPFCPKSPRFLLIKKGEEAEAREALTRFRGSTYIDDELEEMRMEASKSVGVSNYTIKELLVAPELRIPLLIACVLQVTQQWSGINAVMSYSSALFQQVSISEETIPYVVVGTGAINVLCTIFAVPLMEKLGRRPLLLYPMMMMFVSFIVMCIFLNLSKKDSMAEYEEAFAYVCIITMHTYIIGFALGLGPIPFLVVSEIFRQEPRAAAMSLSTAFNWVTNFILMLSFPFLKDGLEEFIYLLFCVVLALAIVFIFFLVPETKNRTFDDIANSIALGGRAKGKGKSYGVSANGEEREPMSNSKV